MGFWSGLAGKNNESSAVISCGCFFTAPSHTSLSQIMPILMDKNAFESMFAKMSDR